MVFNLNYLNALDFLKKLKNITGYSKIITAFRLHYAIKQFSSLLIVVKETTIDNSHLFRSLQT